MKKTLTLIAAATLSALSFASWADTLTVGASNTPHAEILEQAKPILAKQGIDLEIKPFQDYILPNTALAGHDIDANYFQHIPYLNSVLKDHAGDKDYDFVSAGAIHIEPIGIYSKKYKSLKDLPEGGKIIMRDAVSEEGRILSIFEKEGVIKLKPGIDKVTARISDIVENPKKLQFTPNVEASLLPQMYNNDEGAAVVINANYAIDAGLDPVHALIDNPAFDSQTKETLTLRQSSFGSKCEFSEDFLKKVSKSGVVESLLSWAEFKHSKDLKKTDGTKSGKVRGISKLEDANEAGTRNSEKCTLILTEGDSAKSLAVAGLSVVGRDYYGVFPLRGKLLNVREASHKQLMENAEIQNLKRILGLQQGKEYANVKSLRYGHLMIMTDQDHDGSHIKGLLINFIHSFWPSLLKVPSFMVEFITPIVKAKKGNNKISFYTMPEYESWKESLGGNAKGWTIKYYKGLGTSTSEEAKEYFKNLEYHKKEFVWENEHDGEAIELAFSKKKIEARKNWLRQFESGTHLDHNQKLIKYTEFINKELILFSMADLQRSIPSMVDGLKPGQRKILFCCFKRNFVKEAKVAQFSGYVSEHSAYHHGEQSLCSTIIGMAQDFVGSNNINLLRPNGQFGSRNLGGKDAASPRYIFTNLSPITRYLFPKGDDGLLDYLNEDGQSIEPTWYVPIIPTVLVNGSEGIGTGWSSYIPNYNPRDIIANIRHLLNGEPMEPMHPWYRKFKGTIEKTTSKEAGVTYTVSGIIEEVDETTLSITELPIRRWTQDYKEFLEAILMGNDAFITDYKQYSTDLSVKFEVTLTKENMMMAKQEGLLKKFKLTTTISTSNMHLFDSRGTIKKYDTPEQILEEFFHLRLEFYEKRKKFLLENLEMELLKMDNKVRFILGVVKGEIIVSNRKRADLFLELQEKGFTPFPKKSKSAEVSVAGATDDVEETENSEVGVKEVQVSDYDYLLSMAIGTLTLEKVQELCAERDKIQNDVEEVRKATPKSLWLKDLDDLEIQLEEQDKEDEKAFLEEEADVAKRKGKGEAGKRVQRQAPKNARKINKKETTSEAAAEAMEFATSSAMETENVAPVVKPKGQGGSRKAKKVVSDDEDDEDFPDLRERIAKLNSSTDNSTAMETEKPQEPAGKKQPTKRAAATRKKPAASLSAISESISEIDINDEDSEVIEVAAPEAGKKGGRKAAANSKAAKPPAAAKKRGPAASKQSQQKLLTEMLKPAENSGISPEKKVRKMRASPFNKKSGSVLGRVGISKIEAIDSDDTSASGSSPMSENSPNSEEVSVVIPARARPQRANRKQTTYVLSDSETDNASDDDFESDNASDDEDF
ncbi:DNA topoisomerase II, eukaryotic-type [Corchorus olitorius]|uniref:DNA topoisomerase (ATP-hydrolyzing) n=7 Tax=cellular organisms TaxID=131567 RepID=A0A1R3JPM0_9ROSI|nr:DNA topoisomerase II, eukaryotic-type [Corchorus olitorius]